MKTLSSKASQKLRSLQRISIFLDPQKKKLLFNPRNLNSVTAYLFGCYAQVLVWMLCSRRLNSLVNHVHEKAPRFVYDDHSSSYSELIMTYKETTIHHRNNIKVLIKKCIGSKTIYVHNKKTL